MNITDKIDQYLTEKSKEDPKKKKAREQGNKMRKKNADMLKAAEKSKKWQTYDT